MICTDPNNASGVAGCVSDTAGGQLIQPFDMGFKGSYVYSELGHWWGLAEGFFLACLSFERFAPVEPSHALCGAFAYPASAACSLRLVQVAPVGACRQGACATA